MATIVTRSGKGSPLTNTEVDSNFSNLNTDKLEDASGSTSSDGNEYVRKNGAWSVATGGGGASVTTSATAPSSPSDGDLWFSETNGVTYIYYNDGSSSQWVASGAPVLEQFQAAGTNVGTLQTVTNNGASSSNAISVAGLTSNSITYPTTDGAADQVIKTNGSGTLSFDYPKTVHAFFKGAHGTTTNIVSPSSAPTWNPINVSFSESASHPAAEVSVDSYGYITVPTGTYLFNAMLYLQRSDTGAAITIAVNTQYQGANKQTEYAMTLPAGTASAYETVSITCRAVVTYSSGSPPGNRYIYLDIESAFTSTAAKLIGSGTNISLVRVG